MVEINQLKQVKGFLTLILIGMFYHLLSFTELNLVCQKPLVMGTDFFEIKDQ